MTVFKQITLFLALFSGIAPIHAMKRATQQLLSKPVRTPMVAKHLAKPTIDIKSQVPIRPLSGSNKYEQGHSQDKSHTHAFNPYAIPSIGAVAVGLAMAQEHALEESRSIVDTLDIFDITAVLEIFKNGTEDEKRELAQKIAKKITSYSDWDIIKMLRKTSGRPHRIVLNALIKNIRSFSFDQITGFLYRDNQEETHELFAYALAKHYDSLIGNTVYGKFFGSPHYKNNRGNFAFLISVLNQKYQSILIRVIANDIMHYRIDEIVFLLHNYNSTISAENRAVVCSAIINNSEQLSLAFILRILKRTNEAARKDLVSAMIHKGIIEKMSMAHQKQILDVSGESAGLVLQAIVPPICAEIKKYVEDVRIGQRVLIRCMQLSKKYGAMIVDALMLRFEDDFLMYESELLWHVLNRFERGGTHENNQIRDLVFGVIIQNIEKYNAQDAINFLDRVSGRANELLFAAIIRNMGGYSSGDVVRLFESISEQDRRLQIAQAVVDNIEKYDIDLILTRLQFKGDGYIELILRAIEKKTNDFIGEQKIDSQSVAHLRKNTRKAWEYVSKLLTNPKYKEAFQEALSHEHAISDKSAVFYHSQRSPVYWLELLYTKLWEQKYQQKVGNYLFTRFPDEQTEFSNAVLQAYGQSTKTKLLAKGRKYGQDELRPYLLFANYALFGNLTNTGSCSIFYFLKNHNVGDPAITTQTILDKFGDQALFSKYNVEFKQLEKEFKEIVPKSVLLQLTIPHENLNEHVYLAFPGGMKKKLKISGEETDNVATIVNTLKTAPETFDNSDMQEFCVVMTPDTVHTLREQGAEIRAYGDFDQSKLDALIAKLEALIARIAQENPKSFEGKMTPAQSYKVYKPVLDVLMKKKN